MYKSWRQTARPRRTIRDFHRARYGNPLFAHQKTTRQSHPGPDRRPLILALLAIMTVIGGIWYVLWGPAFHITAVEVTGVTGPTADAIRAGVDHHLQGSTLFILPRANILIFNKTKALADIASNVYLDTITLRKKLPGTLEVEAHEKTTRAALDWNNRLFALDDAGYVLRELSDKEIVLLGDMPPGMDAVSVQGLGAETVTLPTTTPQTVPPPTVPAAPQKTPTPEPPAPAKTNAFPLIVGSQEGDSGKGGDYAKPGQGMFSAATMRTVLQANSRLRDVAGAPVRWFRIQESSETVEADMVGEWRVLLSTATPFDVQAERLGIVLKEKIGAQKSSLEYVDLRYNERIFFRMKSGGVRN